MLRSSVDDIAMGVLGAPAFPISAIYFDETNAETRTRDRMAWRKAYFSDWLRMLSFHASP